MGRMVPIAIPKELAAVLRYRKRRTGMPMTKQLEKLIFNSAAQDETDAADCAKKSSGDV